MLFDAISQAFLTTGGTTCVTNPSTPSMQHQSLLTERSSTSNAMAAQGHFTLMGKARSQDWAAAGQVVCTVWWWCWQADDTGHTCGWQRQSRAHTGPLHAAQEPLLSLPWSSEGHHTPACGFHSSHPGKAGGKTFPDLFSSGWWWYSSHQTLDAHQVGVSAEINPLCSPLSSGLGAHNRMGWILL